MSAADLASKFSESVGVEKARALVTEAADAVGVDGGPYESDELVELCEVIRERNSGYVELIAHELQIAVQARDRFLALFENVPDPAVVVEYREDEPIVTAVNTAFESVFGFEEEAIAGESLNDYIVPDEHGDEGEEIDRLSMSGERVEREVTRRTADGTLREFLFRSMLVDREDGRREGYGIYTDITERKRRERDLERKNERLEQFASVVSHDLRTPLSVAQGYLDILSRKYDDDDTIESMKAAHDRMSALIERLLFLAREGQTLGERETVDVKQQAVLSWTTVDSPEASISFPTELGSLSADPERLRQLFENLFRNATEHGGSDVTVTVGPLDRDSHVCNGFYVEDDGVGIPADEREAVFESGYSTNEYGTGLGLAIVEEIVDAHGWTIVVTDGDAGGARFEICTG